jgi:hypothetical protein
MCPTRPALCLTFHISASLVSSPDGRFVYVSSGGYYRDHNLLAFSRNAMAGGVLSPIQNIDVYNTSANRVLPRYAGHMV